MNRAEAKLKSFEYIQKYLVDFEQKKALPTPPQVQEKTIAEKPVSKIAIPASAFTSIYKKYLNERQPSPGSVREFETVVKRFVAICGDRDIRLYGKKVSVYEFISQKKRYWDSYKKIKNNPNLQHITI